MKSLLKPSAASRRSSVTPYRMIDFMVSLMGTSRTPQLPPSLESVLAYKHPGVVERLKKDLKISKEAAEKLFEDTLRFLYLCGAHRAGGPYSPPPLIDEGWHTFILFTREYREFCLVHFGRFIDHVPTTDAMRKARKKLPRPSKTIVMAKKIFGKLSKNWVKASGCEECRDCGDSCCGD